MKSNRLHIAFHVFLCYITNIRSKHYLTIKEIAKLAGVSTATVSRALNGQPGVLPEKQQYILQLAKDLNYQPNVLAKGLSSK